MFDEEVDTCTICRLTCGALVLVYVAACKMTWQDVGDDVAAS